MCGKGSQTTTSSSAPAPQAMQLYQNLLTQAQGVAGTPYQPYGGELVAPVNQQQTQGIAGINANANFAAPYIQQAAQYAQQGASPITSGQIQQYESPYTQQVVNATQAQFNNQNQQQQQQVTGNAIAQGALGGNRTAVAQSELANQQQLAQAPVIAGLQNQGYQTGLSTALAEQQAAAQGAYSMGNLGVAGENAALTGANAQVGAGTLQQQTQQAQDTAAYQQFLNQQAYPFQTTQWLAGIGTGVGSQMGGTSQTTAPSPSLLGQIFGGVAGGAGILGSTGAFGSSGWLAPAFAGLKTGGAVREGVAGNEGSDGPMPESHETLLVQQHQLRAGHRRAQMFPHGTPELPLPQGMQRTVSHSGVFHHNPTHLSVDDIHAAARGGRENDVLDLGPYSKHEIWHRVQQGEHPVAIVERNHNGTEVRAAAGTVHTAGHQLAAMHRTKSPGHTLSVEELHHVLSHRAGNSGVAHRDSGGGVNYQTFGGGFGTPVVPYSGGKSWVPSMGIQHGPGAPRPPGVPNQQQNGIAGQMKNIGALANSISSGMRGNSNLGDDGLGDTNDPTWTGGTPLDGSLPIGSGGIGSARRGGVIGYADGGYADGGGDDDSFAGRFDAGNQPVPPSLSDVPLGDLPGKGFGDAATPTVTGDNTPNVPLPQQRPATPIQGVAPIQEAGVPLPPEQPLRGVAPIAEGRPVTRATPTSGYSDAIDNYRRVIGSMEGGHNYQNVTTTKDRNGNPQSALGLYGVMDFNVAPWTKEVLGQPMSPQEFLHNPEAQDAVFRAKFGQYVNHYGPEGAARAWLGGPGGVNNPNATDPLGTRVGDYGRKFMAAAGLGGADAGLAATDSAAIPPEAKPAQQQGVAGPNIDWSGNSKLWPALMAAGFGMMASRSPFAGVAIGEGAQQGLQTYAEEKNLEANRGFTQRKIDLEAQKLSQEADRWQKDYSLKTLPYQGVMTAEQKAQMGLKQQELEAKLMEPKPYYNTDTGQMDYTVRTPEGDVVSLGTGKIIVGPHRGQVIPNNNTPGVPNQPPTGQVGQPNQQQPGFQQTAFHPDGVWRVNSQQAAGPTDYSNGSKLPYIEHGMAVPDPAPVAGYSPDTIKTAAEWYLKTGKQPIISRGASPVAQMQNSYARAVMNYGNSLAASRGVSREDLTDIWQTAPRVGQFILGQPGQQIVSLGTAMRHLETLKEYEDAWQKAKLGDTRPLNNLQAFIKTQWGSDAATNLNTVAHILGPEIIKAIGVAGAGTDKDRADAAAQFTAGGSDQQVNGAIQATERLLRGQLIGKENQARAAGLSEDRLRKMIGTKEYQELANLDQGTPAQQPGTAAPAQRTLTPQDQQALGWAKANANDPRAAAIMQRLGAQ